MELALKAWLVDNAVTTGQRKIYVDKTSKSCTFVA